MHIYVDSIQMEHKAKNMTVVAGPSIKLRMPAREEDLF